MRSIIYGFFLIFSLPVDSRRISRKKKAGLLLSSPMHLPLSHLTFLVISRQTRTMKRLSTNFMSTVSTKTIVIYNKLRMEAQTKLAA
jgi:hypothetical protein